MHETGLKAVDSPRRERTPLVIGHRGAPSYRPEHTLASYELAIDLGADLIEPDLVVTRDGVLVARHENELSRSTDVAHHPEFATRRRTQEVDGKEVTGWFVEDFTLAELRTLRAMERMPDVRPLNTAYDGRFGVLTLAEVVAIARRRSSPERPVRVQAELKHPTWFAAQGLPMIELLIEELSRLNACSADGPVVLQSFDRSALRQVRTGLGANGPMIVQLVRDGVEHDALLTRNSLLDIAQYAQAVGPSMDRVLIRGGDQELTGVSDIVDEGHRAGLDVHVWKIRPENAFLAQQFRRGDDPAGVGDAQAEARLLLDLGVDALITDAPETAVRARAASMLHANRMHVHGVAGRRHRRSGRWSSLATSSAGPTPETA